ncbi:MULTISPECIES: sensor histidine kinase [unclassified Arsukibacterium]|uniref:sensor histidine kinase n=1 Tax=unclassified Arsukibacterium TaxID=2635278 RepID=UPI000C8A4FAB|nr:MULTISPECIES: ATP-binding protein [unclassified Arsukibacterium]MAA96308.1 PAS domain-containing sensor histidine kinase [Rheinheimera sp.]HAW93127.1 PAS domain-containing sensor histidine kinase [Candidatus Azambacteria bacterium]|tara:strand:+ start:172 stop:1326 length:1155 start_codon:yes stop_codon:yes gene_type:complete
MPDASLVTSTCSLQPDSRHLLRSPLRGPQEISHLVSQALADSGAADNRLQHILNVLPSGVILLSARGIVSEANPVATTMLGQPLLGQKWLEVINRCFAPRRDDGLEVSLKDGRRIKLEISPLSPEPGQLIVLTDLTQTRQLQSRLAHLQRLSTLGKMMATLAHQIRTPLSSAMLYAENLGSSKLNPAAAQQFQQKLLARLHDLEQQVNDMLLFARSGTAQAVQPFTLQRLLSEVNTASEVMLQQHNAQLTISTRAQDTYLLGNLSSLTGAFNNLIQNSVQAINEGAHIHISAKTQGNGLQFIINDNGPGIAADLQPHIFEPFFSRRQHGSGLGLAVVQAVVNSHQGDVRYEQRPDCGACFIIELPIHFSDTTSQQVPPHSRGNQ